MANTTALRKVVPVNPVAFDAIGELDQMVAFLEGAIAMLKCSVEWETDSEDINTVYLIEAAIERAGKLRQALDCGLVDVA